MKIAKSGRIQDFCQPNALLSLQEYMEVGVYVLIWILTFCIPFERKLSPPVRA